MTYTITRNGRAIKVGRKEFKNDIEEETFVLKMIQRYTRDDNDAVDVLFR